jgi:nicotinate-nucleotide pyrophosphorylase (carboxylating)
MTPPHFAELAPSELQSLDALITLALDEDLAQLGDITSLSCIPAEATGKAAFVVRQSGVLAGLAVCQRVCQRVDPNILFEPIQTDGSRVTPYESIADIEGPMRSILAVERTALNFLQHLCGIASLTRQYVDAIGGYPARIFDTRKTLPGWRLLEKYAVRMGGGINHRMGLFDAILIKDNHLAAMSPAETAIECAIERSRKHFPGVAVEIEVDSLEQLERALRCKAEIVLLDNMSKDQLRVAVKRRNEMAPGVLLEASGGVNLQTVNWIASTGVDRISVGALTHSAPALDIGLDYLS